MSDRPPALTRDDGRLFDGLGAPVFRLIHPTTVGSQNIGVSLCAMAPGDEVRRHRHPYEEVYYVIRGRGSMYLEGHGEIPLTPGLSVYIAPDLAHGQINTGDEPLDILCSLSPPPVEGVLPTFVDEEE